MTILCIRSYAQLRAIFKEYEAIAGHPIQEGLKKEFSGDLLRIFQSIGKTLQLTRSPIKIFN